MSKRNLFLGTASGKVGDVVFFRSKGEQKARGYVIPTDAKSYGQIVSRMKMLNPVSAFRAMKPMIQSNFLSKKTNQSDFNAFVSANKSSAPFFIAKSDLQANACVPFGMQVSSGHDGVTFKPRYAAIANGFEKNDPYRYGIAVTSGFRFKDFPVLADKTDSAGIHYLSDSEIFDFVKQYFQCSIPAGFTLHVMACDYGMDADNGTDVWQPYVLSRVYSATGACQRVSWGHEPGYRFHTGESLGYSSLADEFTRVGVVPSDILLFDSRDEGNPYGTKVMAGLGLVIGSTAITTPDLGARAVAIAIEWDAADGHHVTTSYVCNPTWAFNGDTDKTDDVVKDTLAAYYLEDFVYNGLYFEQLLEDNPYKGSIQPLSYPSVILDDMLFLAPEFSTEEEDEAA